MKRELMLLAMGAASTLAFAQRTETKSTYFDTQARIVSSEATAYVRPITVEMQVDANIGRKKWVVPFDAERIKALDGDVARMRSFALAQIVEQELSGGVSIDAVVAPTFSLRPVDGSGSAYQMTVIGYLGRFKNWGVATEADYKWITSERARTTADRTNYDAIVK